MTKEEFDRLMPILEMVRRLERKLHAQLIERGIDRLDVLIGAIYAAHALSTEQHNGPIAGIEWMRTALDTIERQVLAGSKADG